MTKRPLRLLVVLSLPFLLIWTGGARPDRNPLTDSFRDWRQHPAIQYATMPPADPVAELDRRVQSGQITLKTDGQSRYLRAILDELRVPVSSQIAVFAKDSVQAGRIEPHNPRTLFFNDSVAVGWVRGGFIELAAQDPRQGTVFYALDPTLLGGPRFTRRNDCLSCHHSYNTAGVPGMLVKSAGHGRLDHRLAMNERWGGWYVTGQHGSIRHLGNAALDRVFAIPPPAGTFNWPSLAGKFETSGYLSVHSDIVALMVFEHQMHLMNLLTRIGWEARVADYEKHAARLEPSEPRDPVVPMDEAAAEVADYLLFVDEAPLSDRVRGSTEFAATFAARGPRDRKGRSLRDLDLERRLMRYPCSYLIHSVQFAGLPPAAKNAIYRRMWVILSGAEKDTRYKRLTPADRRAVVEILRDTEPGLPDYFRRVIH